MGARANVPADSVWSLGLITRKADGDVMLSWLQGSDPNEDGGLELGGITVVLPAE